MWHFFLCRANRCLPCDESCILKNSHTFFCENFVKYHVTQKSSYSTAAEVAFHITQAAEIPVSSLDPLKHTALNKVEVNRCNPSALLKAAEWPYDRWVWFIMTMCCMTINKVVNPFWKLFIRGVLAFFSFFLMVLSLHSQSRMIQDPTVCMAVLTSVLHLPLRAGELVSWKVCRLEND